MMPAERDTKPLYRGGLIEVQRGNLRALLRHLHRELGSWVRVAHAVGYRRQTVVEFFREEHPGNIPLARGIARACNLTLEDALIGKAPKKAGRS